jgi:hypothetical protein
VKSERSRSGVLNGHWITMTFVAGMRSTGITAPFVINRPIDRAAFEAYVAKVLVSEAEYVRVETCVLGCCVNQVNCVLGQALNGT